MSLYIYTWYTDTSCPAPTKPSINTSHGSAVALKNSSIIHTSSNAIMKISLTRKLVLSHSSDEENLV